MIILEPLPARNVMQYLRESLSNGGPIGDLRLLGLLSNLVPGFIPLLKEAITPTQNRIPVQA